MKEFTRSVGRERKILKGEVDLMKSFNFSI